MDELNFIKAHVATLSSLPTTYPDSYQPALEDFPKRIPVLQVDILPPPERKAESSTTTSAQVTITIKSLKPPLTFSLSVQPTDSIASLKDQLASQPRAPPADAQRLLLKGKALSDNKLLKEYGVGDGATVNLMVKPGHEWTGEEKPAAVAAAKGTSDAVKPEKLSLSNLPSPGLTPTTASSATSRHSRELSIPSVNVSPAPSAEGKEFSPQPIVLDTTFSKSPDPNSSTATSYHTKIADPAFWEKLHAFFGTEFATQTDADSAFEAMLLASKDALTAHEIAKIRDSVGVVGMAGT